MKLALKVYQLNLVAQTISANGGVNTGSTPKPEQGMHSKCKNYALVLLVWVREDREDRENSTSCNSTSTRTMKP